MSAAACASYTPMPAAPPPPAERRAAPEPEPEKERPPKLIAPPPAYGNKIVARNAGEKNAS